ncbi:hypothetical protein J3F83DRAFT_740538 [Trichoderma novae-zelandiae]
MQTCFMASPHTVERGAGRSTTPPSFVTKDPKHKAEETLFQWESPPQPTPPFPPQPRPSLRPSVTEVASVQHTVLPRTGYGGSTSQQNVMAPVFGFCKDSMGTTNAQLPCRQLTPRGLPNLLHSLSFYPSTPFSPSFFTSFLLFFTRSRSKCLASQQRGYFVSVLVPVFPVPRWFVARDNDIMYPKTDTVLNPLGTEHRASLSLLRKKVRKKTR